MKNPVYGIYIYNHVAELDCVGPHSVFALSNIIDNRTPNVVLISEMTDPITGIGGMKITPDATFDDHPDLDVLLLPGTADVADHALKNKRALPWIKAQAEKVTFLTAVCTGGLILQKAGLLKGKKATTHWMETDLMAEDPDTTVIPDVRYVRDGNIVTSQGVSAGIDMALWLVGQLHSPEHARQVRKIMQYDPAPPYTADV
ncbi:DJ-1/PfpI family protein [Pseudodesulfovibrio piezophilus]|uniref:ThiJ/PfpI domain protein n=1 Tax=Pseudodesulfovibrio piezophilus (strain DSM 21447 / JCM 15486 / C1TLV30) TaxID=1322246 RepID=M1WTL9_PSEP2|nr:DJ-1/PfpI family protein [Pseudodesulfovibrio piezophilus]CCH49732.1 ThiJ/PfpI domain protein [Pseudodesulfovibrio piezophilus C1TLV30]